MRQFFFAAFLVSIYASLFITGPWVIISFILYLAGASPFNWPVLWVFITGLVVYVGFLVFIIITAERYRRQHLHKLGLITKAPHCAAPTQPANK